MLTIQLLGGLKITIDGAPGLALARPRGMALLAYLLLHHAVPQDRAHLAATFWPESSDSQARTNLRRELHQLRQAFPLFAQLIQSEGQSIQAQIPADGALDVDEFTRCLEMARLSTDLTVRKQQYQAATDLYQGDLLPGYYDDWVLAKREELRQAYIRALETFTILLVDDREYAKATTLTQRLLQYDPLYEAGYCQLMQLYTLQNDRARTLHTYHSCATVLERELGVPPSEATEQLYQRLLHAEPQITGARQANPTTALQLVGRKLEWQTLLNTWRRAAQGHAHTVLIEGEAGIGKTRIAEELFDWVSRQGIPAARTRSYAAEGALAYAPVIEWLRSPALHTAIVQLNGVWRTELARLLPELLTEFPHLSPPEPLIEHWQRQRLFEALARAITVGAQPKLLIIDDLQWCDQETLEWLRFLLHFAANAPLLVVGTVRSGETEEVHPLHALSREVRISNQLTTLNLAPLNAAETAELVAQVRGDQIDGEATNHLYQVSEGNPLFVVEMAQSGWTVPLATAQTADGERQVLSPKVYAVIQHRLAQLSPAARRLVALAATLGRSFSFVVLVAASDSDEDAVVTALDELWRRRVIREQGTGKYDFSHDRIREAAYAEVSPIRRKQLHRRAAQALEAVYAHTLDTVSAQLALHYNQAGLVEQAVHWYQQAGQVAWRMCAFHDAVHYQRTAIALLHQLPVTKAYQTMELALQVEFSESLAVILGFTPLERQQALLRARELALHLNKSPTLASLLLLLANLYLALGDAQQMHLYAQEARTLANQMTDLIGKAHLCGAESRILLHVGAFERAEALLMSEVQNYKEVYQATLSEFTYKQFIIASSVHAFVQWIRGYPDQAQSNLFEHRLRADQGLTPYQRSIFAFMTSLLQRNLGDDEALAAEVRIMVEFGKRYDFRMSQYSGNIFGGWLLAKQGNPAAGVEKIRAGVEGYKTLDHVMYHPHRLAMFVEVLLWNKLVSEAAEVLAQALGLSARCDQHFWDAELYRLQGDLWLAQGEPAAQAESAYQHAIAIAQQQTAKSLELRATLALCRLWQRQGRTREAYQTLAAIYGWFTEGFATQDLRAAQALLMELSA